MKKRGTISRCCCGDGAGAGVCGDACEQQYNNCAASAIGDVYTDSGDAETNCGYLLQTQTVPIGADGIFEVQGSGTTNESRRSLLRKQFQFDYRTRTQIFAELDVEVSPVQFGAGNGSVTLDLLGGTSAFVRITSSRITAGAGGDNYSIPMPPNTIATIRMELDIGDVVSTSRDPVRGCVDTVACPVRAYVNGSQVASGSTNVAFYGKECFRFVNIDVIAEPPTRPFISSITYAKTTRAVIGIV